MTLLNLLSIECFEHVTAGVTHSLLENVEFDYVSKQHLFLTNEECRQMLTVKCRHVPLQSTTRNETRYLNVCSSIVTQSSILQYIAIWSFQSGPLRVWYQPGLASVDKIHTLSRCAPVSR